MSMRGKGLIKWPKQVTTSLVEQLIKAEKNVEKALVVFDSATAEYGNGFRHDHKTYGLIISKLLSVNQFRPAEDFLDRMRVEECKVTEEIFMSLCRAYGRVHKPNDVLRIFEKMKEYDCEPSERSYVTVFSILVDENQLKVALKFYRFMRQAGITPSVASLNVLIKALCKNSGTMDSAIKIFREMPNRGCVPDTYTYGTLINGFCRMGKISEAKELLAEMELKGCTPSVVTYTSLIHGLCRLDNLDEAMGLLEEMELKNIKPNVYTYSALMDGLCKGGHSSKAMEVLEMMVAKNHKPNMVTYSTLIHGLCKEKKLQDALEIFDRMKLQGLKPDAGLYWKIINGFCEAQKFQEAANFLDEMVFAGTPIKRLTWSLHVKIHNTVVCGLCSGNDLNRAFQLYQSIRTRGISVEAETFDSLVRVCCRKHDMHKAARIVDEMVIDGCVPGEATWNIVICGLWGRFKVQNAAELIQHDQLMAEVIAGDQS